MSLTVKNASAVDVKLKTTVDGSSEHAPHHHVDSCALPTGAATSAKQDTLLAAVATAALQTSGTQKVIIANATDTAAIEARAVTGIKGLCVNIGPTDPISDIPVVMDFDHHQNHEGEAYQAIYYNTSLNGTQNLYLIVPAYATAIRSPHLSLELISDVTTNMYLFEAPTPNAAGTTFVDIRNRNRIGTPNTAGMTIKSDTTFTVDGTLLSHYMTIASARSSIASDTSKAEWILKPSTNYLLRITTAASGIVLCRLNWYEDLGV